MDEHTEKKTKSELENIKRPVLNQLKMKTLFPAEFTTSFTCLHDTE